MKTKKTIAKENSKTGKYHQTFNALWDKLDNEIVEKNTGKQLGKIIDLMRDQNQIGGG